MWFALSIVSIAVVCGIVLGIAIDNGMSLLIGDYSNGRSSS